MKQIKANSRDEDKDDSLKKLIKLTKLLSTLIKKNMIEDINKQ